MKKIELGDISGFAAYERIREKQRQRIIELKQRRRVAVGDKVTLLFENRDTIIFQIHEMMRAERIGDLDKIRGEIEVYNELIPGPHELSATLFIEIDDQANVREDLLKFLGIDEAVYLDVGTHRIRAVFEAGRGREDKISAVQYVIFPFSDAALQALTSGEKVELLIDHTNYKAAAPIERATRESLIEDLTGET
jgi:hypothetical protein